MREEDDEGRACVHFMHRGSFKTIGPCSSTMPGRSISVLFCCGAEFSCVHCFRVLARAFCVYACIVLFFIVARWLVGRFDLALRDTSKALSI